MIAVCYRSGEIDIVRRAPRGTFPLCSGRRACLLAIINGSARLAHDGATWLVPGVPEAGDDEDAAIEAVVAYARLVRARQPLARCHRRGGVV